MFRNQPNQVWAITTSYIIVLASLKFQELHKCISKISLKSRRNAWGVT
jgi:hypothetical protein